MKALPAVLALALAAPVSAANAASTITPGYWESTNRLLSPIKQTKTERRCITPAEVEKFMSGPSNRHYACTYPTKVFAGGHIRLKGSCVSKKGRKVAVQGQGSYTPTSFNLTAEIATEFLGLDITGKASTEARRIADTCPSPAEIEAQNKDGQ
jgi:Cu/Zn superoxide dismutase